jgi:hypothetical protein
VQLTGVTLNKKDRAGDHLEILRQDGISKKIANYKYWSDFVISQKAHATTLRKVKYQ